MDEETKDPRRHMVGTQRASVAGVGSTANQLPQGAPEEKVERVGTSTGPARPVCWPRLAGEGCCPWW